jgi:hypothetical protein
LSYVNDAHIAALATAMRDNTSVTSISFSEISTRDGFGPSPVVTDVGVARLLELARNLANITRIDVDKAKFFCRQGKLDAGLWAAFQAACEVRHTESVLCVFRRFSVSELEFCLVSSELTTNFSSVYS